MRLRYKTNCFGMKILNRRKSQDVKSKTKRLVKRRGKYKCAECKKKKKPKNLQVDHIQQIYMGGSHKLHNLRCVCKSCHRKKTKEENKMIARKLYGKNHQREIDDYNRRCGCPVPEREFES